jgi:hypothetical protein
MEKYRRYIVHNFNDKEFIDYINNLMKFKYVDLGSLSSNKMIEYFTITRK